MGDNSYILVVIHGKQLLHITNTSWKDNSYFMKDNSYILVILHGRQLFHSTFKMYMVAVGLWLLSRLIFVIAYAKYSTDGLDVRGVKTAGMFSWLIFKQWPYLILVFVAVNRAYDSHNLRSTGHALAEPVEWILRPSNAPLAVANAKIRYSDHYSNAKSNCFRKKTRHILCFCFDSMWWLHNEATSWICLWPSMSCDYLIRQIAHCETGLMWEVVKMAGMLFVISLVSLSARIDSM